MFAPDVSNIYMPVVAGLADMGFNGLALTPEYGARNRFITVITDAVIAPDPLIPPGTVCDQCMLCRKHCPTGALATEINGEKVLKIADYEYRFPNKNLWRCAWGEHFDLDLDLKIPEVVTEQVILDNVKEHGIRSGEMGQCLKFCVPKPIRTFDRAYSKTPMRRYHEPAVQAGDHRAIVDRLLLPLLTGGANLAVVSSAEELRAAGTDLERFLPGAQSAITVVVTGPNVGAQGASFGGAGIGASYQVNSLCYDLTRALEALGYRSLMTVERSGSPPDPVKDRNPTGGIVAGLTELKDCTVIANTVITRMALPAQRRGGVGGSVSHLDVGDAKADLAGHLCDLARSLGADLSGVASATRLDELATQLRPVFEQDEILDATDESIRFTEWAPSVTVRHREVRTASDWLPGARAVLVFGLRYHKEVLRWATKPPAEAVGPYAFQTYVTNWIGSVVGYRLVQCLEQLGYAATMVTDLTGTDSVTANPRGPQPDLFSNRFAGLAAGLGQLTVSGHLATPQFGIRQRLVAIVTNAPLTASPLASSGQAEACAGCDRPCIGSCPSKAITTEEVRLTCEDRNYRFNRIDGKRCDWVKRYALMGESGFKYLGSKVDVPAPDTITAEALADALRQHDSIKKYRPVVAEPCVINCPLAGTQKP